MSLTTYGGLKTAIATWATRSDLTAQLDDFVFWAHQEICRKLRANVLVTGTDVSVAGEIVAVPADFLAIQSFYIDQTPRVMLQTVSPQQANELTGQVSSYTTPQVVAVDGSNFRFAPTPGATVTGKLRYYAKPVLMAADSDHNVVLDRYPYLYLFGALEALYTYLEDDNNADRYGQRFGALMADINGKDGIDAMSGLIQTTGTVGSVV